MRAAAKNAAPSASSHESNDWSVSVRSKDGFSFPVDVRVACAVEAKNTPYLVALLGNPDAVVQDDQEDEKLEVLEARIVLPAVRAIFRNVAETMNALEFVNRRSEIEALATKRITAEFARYRISCDGVYVGNIHLDASAAGQQLLATQTDRKSLSTSRNFTNSRSRPRFLARSWCAHRRRPNNSANSRPPSTKCGSREKMPNHRSPVPRVKRNHRSLLAKAVPRPISCLSRRLVSSRSPNSNSSNS